MTFRRVRADAAAGERWRTGVARNPLSNATVQDPWPVYAALRARGAPHRSRLMNAWLITRHADADAILRDHRSFASDPRVGKLTRRQQAMLPPADEFTMLIRDPPDHTRLRALVGKAFTARAVGALEARIRAVAAELLDAVDELLRFDSPVQATIRRVRADCAVNGFELRARDNVVVLVGAANRDPDVFDEPDRLDVGRADCPHLSLGRGIHHCLGAPLARLEGRIAFETLLERFPRIELLGPRPKYHHGVVLRSLRSLPLRCARA